MRVLVMLALAACDSPGQTEVHIYSTMADGSDVRYAVTGDSLVVREGSSIVELDLDGTPLGTVFDQPFLQMTAGHGWVAWSDVVAIGNNMFTPRFLRRTPAGLVEQATSPMANASNIDGLLATPDGIVIHDSYSQTLLFWGATTIEPLALGETGVWPIAFDSGWLYATVNASSGTQLMRFQLDGSRKEPIVAFGFGGATAFAVHGTRAAYTTYAFPTSTLHLIDLETRRDREIGELSYPYSSGAMAIDDTHVFADRYRHTDELAPFLPLTNQTVRRLDVVGDDLFWSVEYVDQNGYSGELSIYRAAASGDPLSSPPSDDDTRPPWF